MRLDHLTLGELESKRDEYAKSGAALKRKRVNPETRRAAETNNEKFSGNQPRDQQKERGPWIGKY